MEEPNKPDAGEPTPAEEVVTSEAAAPAAPVDLPDEPVDPVAARKKAIIGLLAAVVLGAAATGIAYYAEKHTGSVATVDGARVPKGDYDRLVEQTKKQYAQRFNVDFASAQGKQMETDLRGGIMNQLVERELIRAEAKRRNLTVPEEAFNAKVAELKKGFKDEAEFQAQLKSNGLDAAEFERQVRDMQLVERVVDAVTSDTKVTDAEVRAYYDQNRKMYDRPEEVRARHVLVKDDAIAKMVEQKARAGADFAALAKEYSEDPGSKGEGGDLGYFGRGKMVKEFEEAAFSTAPGKLSKLVKTRFGWHLLKIEDKKAPRTQGFDEVKDEIRQNLATERRRGAFVQWLGKRKAEAKVEYKPGFAPPPPPAGGEGHGPDDGHGH